MLKQSIRGAAKTIVRNTAPRIYDRLRDHRQRSVRARLNAITDELVRRGMLEVLAGPFAGLTYTPSATAAHYPPKLAGAYEAELHDCFEQVIAAAYPVIVDVGCSEGYYAVGLARRCPASRVYAYDTDENSRRWCAELAAANGAGERVIVSGGCTPETLTALGVERGFLLSDCEGYELELLNPDRAPLLRYWDVLVELHDCYDPSTTHKVLSRFRDSHDIVEIPPARRDGRFAAPFRFLSARERRLAISDLRGDRTHWAFMRSRMPVDR